MADEITPAEGTAQTTTPAPEGTEPPGTATTPPPKGDGPETDLDAWKRHSRFHETQAKKHKADLEAANEELEKLRKASQTEHEKAIEDARKKGAEEAESVWKGRFQDGRRQSEATAMLSKAVLNPELLLPHLDLGSIDVDDEGNVDEGAMAAAVDELLTKFPDQARQRKTAGGGMDMHHKRTAVTGSGGSLESGADMYARRHGKQTT